MASPFHSLLTRPGPIREILVAKLDAYKAGVLQELTIESKAFLAFVRLALTEAEALAWSTSYPHLFLPGLMEEKLQSARLWTSRQRRLGTDALCSHGPEHEAMRLVRMD